MLFLLRTVVAWRGFIIKAALATAIAMAAISFVLPRWFTASTTIFPPESGVPLPFYGEMLQNISLPILGGSLGGIAPETINIDMLRSRRVGARIIEEFNLMERYNVTRFEQALDGLHSHLGFTLLENGLLIVALEDSDPQVAAVMLNRMVEILDDVHAELNISRAARTREFVGAQMREREVLLTEAETALTEYQERTRVLDLDVQLRAAMDIVAQLTGQTIALETELNILSAYTSASSDEYQRKKREYDELVGQLTRLKQNEQESDADMVRSYIPSLDHIPELALDYVRLKRRVEIESTVYTMLVTEYEKARIEETRDTGAIQVLDTARAPSIRSRPKRKLLVIAGGVFGVAWSAMLALLVTVWREHRETSPIIRDVLIPLGNDLRRGWRRPRSS